MWNVRATFELCRLQREEIDSHAFPPVCRRIRFHLSFSTSSNQSSSWTDKSRHIEKKEPAEFWAAQMSLFFFLPYFFFSLALTRDSEQFGRPAVFYARVDGYFSFILFPFFFYEKKIQGWKIGPAVHTLFI